MLQNIVNGNRRVRFAARVASRKRYRKEAYTSVHVFAWRGFSGDFATVTIHSKFSRLARRFIATRCFSRIALQSGALLPSLVSTLLLAAVLAPLGTITAPTGVG